MPTPSRQGQRPRLSQLADRSKRCRGGPEPPSERCRPGRGSTGGSVMSSPCRRAGWSEGDSRFFSYARCRPLSRSGAAAGLPEFHSDFDTECTSNCWSDPHSDAGSDRRIRVVTPTRPPHLQRRHMAACAALRCAVRLVGLCALRAGPAAQVSRRRLTDEDAADSHDRGLRFRATADSPLRNRSRSRARRMRQSRFRNQLTQGSSTPLRSA